MVTMWTMVTIAQNCWDLSSLWQAVLMIGEAFLPAGIQRACSKYGLWPLPAGLWGGAYGEPSSALQPGRRPAAVRDRAQDRTLHPRAPPGRAPLHACLHQPHQGAGTASAVISLRCSLDINASHSWWLSVGSIIRCRGTIRCGYVILLRI